MLIEVFVDGKYYKFYEILYKSRRSDFRLRSTSHIFKYILNLLQMQVSCHARCATRSCFQL